MKIIGVDIGGTKIKAGVVDGSKIYKRIEIETEASKGRGRVVQNIIRVIDSLNGGDVKGIGVGFAGMVDAKKGIVVRSPHIKSMKGFNIKKFLERKYKKKIFVDNDVKAAILAEAKYGAGKKYKNVIMLTIGTGIGSGIVIDGKIYKGEGSAPEMGHTTINFDGIKSTCCNNYGCFEEYVSARGLQRTFGEKINPKIMQDMAERGNVKARKAYQEMGRILGIGITNIANMLDPEVVIVGGGIGKSWGLFEKEMRKTIKERKFIKTKVVKAKLQDSGIIGAALLIK